MTKPCARSGTLYSPAYLAAPVTFARPSTREVGLPRRVFVGVIALSGSLDPLIGLRLRRGARCLRQRAHDGPPRQFDLEIVVAKAARLAQNHLGCRGEVVR